MGSSSTVRDRPQHPATDPSRGRHLRPSGYRSRASNLQHSPDDVSEMRHLKGAPKLVMWSG